MAFRREGGFGRSSGRDSFRGRSGDRSGFGRSSGFRGERRPMERCEVICDKCGKKCEVPFKPTAGKPVYCDECFKKTPSGSGKSMDLEEINTKLDKIISLLEKAK